MLDDCVLVHESHPPNVAHVICPCYHLTTHSSPGDGAYGVSEGGGGGRGEGGREEGRRKGGEG